MRNKDMRKVLQAAQDMPDAARRGRELEAITADLFRRDHFRVQLNPGAARPRQTDLIAIKVTDIYLVECKWRSDKANIDDIDALRSRLRRADTHAIGILLSYRGFTEPVLAEVLANRAQPILLLSGDELERVAAGFYTLSDLLWRKRQALLVDGEVLLDEPTDRRMERLVRLPEAEYELLWPDGRRTRSLTCAGDFGQFVFTHDLTDIDWVPAAGVGVALDIQPSVYDARGLVDLLNTMANLGWATPYACWSIQQSRRNWHGWGPHEFAVELEKWEERATTENAHHSEEIFYTDVCDGGFYTIAATISAHPSRQIRNLNISFQLQGHPLDTRPLLELCHTLGVHENLYLRPRDTESVQRIHLGHKPIDIGEARALITAPEPDAEFGFSYWVTGVVIDNLFVSGHQHLEEGEALELRILEHSELLICDLAEHHPCDGRRYNYFLERIEYARTTDGLVCRTVVNWREV
ncbi:restriction endonuclease [Micromonospora profundi]|uniref:Restriction endonuclease n=1 Tax=Micromonospora profundi TaxID=1420889 RepID=A0AAJ6L1P1_9ACTN|nr:restriction endonuclease [Micromonospora profundi]WLS44775.1 restriction endonuclease [Micromonospora profundi]